MMTINRPSHIAFFVVLMLALCVPTPGLSNTKTAGIVLHGGTVVTLDGDFSATEGIAIEGNRIIAVGASTEVLKHAGHQTRVINLDGAAVLPGINDTHFHALPTGDALTGVPLLGRSLEQVREGVAAAVAATPPGTLIRGTGWMVHTLGRMPSKADLDDIAPDHPVILTESTHHVVLLNSRALELAGFDAETPDADGVTFVRTDDGSALSGVIVEGYKLVRERLPQRSLAERKQSLRAAIELLSAQGITSYTEPGIFPDDVEAYLALAREGSLNARAAAHLWAGDTLAEAERAIAAVPEGLSPARRGSSEGLFTLRGMKLLLDGAPPAKTSATLDDYACCPGVRGRLTYRGETDDERAQGIRQTIAVLHQRGYQLGMHVTGDRSARLAIDAVINAISANPLEPEHPQANGLRHYLIHGDRIHPDDRARMGAWQIGLSANPIFTYHVAPLVQQLWGPEFAKQHMGVAQFVRAGVWTSLASDAPVFPLDWKQSLEFAVTRRSADGATWGKEYALSVREALVAVTAAGAFQDFQEQAKGSLETGRLADLVVLDRNPLAIDPEAISDLVTLMTIVDGRVVYDAM